MKRNLIKRSATALALVTIAGFATACGSSNNQNCVNGVCGIGGALSGSGAAVSMSPMIQFSGTAIMDANGGITAGTSGTSLYMQPIGGQPAPNGPLQPCQLGGAFTAGRCGSDANLGITINGNGAFGGGFGSSQLQITGMLQFNSIAWGYLQYQLMQMGGSTGYQVPMPTVQYPGATFPGYPQGNYGGIGGSLTAIQIMGSGNGLGIGVAGSNTPGVVQSGAQSGGAPETLYSGYVVLTVNGNQIYVPF